MRWDALPREPVRHLAIVVADLPYRCLEEGGIGEGVVVGQLYHGASTAAGESTRPLGTHVVESCFALCIKRHVLTNVVAPRFSFKQFARSQERLREF